MISKLPDESEQVIAVSYINRAYERENTPVQEGKREDTPVQEGKNGSVEGEPSLSNRYIAKAQEETINGILKGENRSVESANNDLSKSIPNDGKVNEDEDIPDGGWGWIVAAGGFLGQNIEPNFFRYTA
ncbi:hypothetical protein SK128_011142 [Halocaridina rubra]|uniref:Uncharacterized protein n=1 Tax=Halocaridina rubra TaxID=373956 RepID=A0AAN8X030_HALRR